MNELQKTELNLLEVFIDICEQLHLTYFLVCGTALGAVKYQGFIPWDDDVDVALYREEYEIFLQKAPMLLPSYYFLQNYKSDPEFPAVFSKLRDSRTTYIEKSAARLNIHHGVYMDIFPLDAYPEDIREQRVLNRRKAIYRRLLSVAFVPNRHWKKIFIAPFRLVGIHRKTQRLAAKYESAISGYPTATAKAICNHGNWQGNLEYAPREQYGQGIMVKFEGLDVRVPEKFDEYLTQKYGDWRADLPEEQKVGHHYYAVLDLEHPYTEYMK